MADAADAADEPEWVRESRSFLAFLAADGPGETGELRARLHRLLVLGERTPPPDETGGPAPPRSVFVPDAARRFEHLDAGDDPDARWVSDDPRDIAGDLATAIAAWDAGQVASAAWEWRFGYETHWGALHARPLLAWLEAGSRQPPLF